MFKKHRAISENGISIEYIDFLSTTAQSLVNEQEGKIKKGMSSKSIITNSTPLFTKNRPINDFIAQAVLLAKNVVYVNLENILINEIMKF